MSTSQPSLPKPPSGTRGKRTPPRVVAKVVLPIMNRVHRRSGDTFGGMQLVYLTTVGAKSGQQRQSTVARFDDGTGGWWVVASYAGAAQHPAWYHNIAAHPDQVRAEVDGHVYDVEVQQLAGDAREQAWQQIIAAAPRFSEYADATDREIPILRLTPRPSSP